MTHQSKYTCEKSASKNGAFKSRLGFLLAIPALLAPVSILLLSGSQESLSSSRRLLATERGMESRYAKAEAEAQWAHLQQNALEDDHTNMLETYIGSASSDSEPPRKKRRIPQRHHLE